MKNLEDYIGKEITFYKIIDDVRNTKDYTIEIMDNYIIEERRIKRNFDDHMAISVQWRGYGYDTIWISKNEFEFISSVAWSSETDIEKIKSIIEEKTKKDIAKLKENISKEKRRIKRLENPKFIRRIEVN